jgi:arginyl-tRNA synthetase
MGISLKNALTRLIGEAVGRAAAKNSWGEVTLPFIEVTPSREEAHGDFASNVAMILASQLKTNPRKIAAALAADLGDGAGLVEKVEIAGPGFINFFLRDSVWPSLLEAVDETGEGYGRSALGAGRKVQVEFVSANPTGPLHIGHGRGAVVGDVIANILSETGHEVSREYYINDAGNQMHNLGRSVLYRYYEEMGRPAAFPENGYQGDYIRDIAKEIAGREGDAYLAADEADVVPRFTDHAGNVILEGIKEDLRVFGVVFERYFSERELYKDGGVLRLLDQLEAQGYVYTDDGTRWFRTTAFGDDKDRVVVRKNGEPTYFAADIAYHLNKFERGFDLVIDIWGADHHGYIPRMRAGVQAVGRPKDALRVILVQLVNLLRDGNPVAMSTRSGEFVTLREVVDEVGKDAARYNFLMRRSDSHLDFDLELAKRQTNENPVFYVQYAHARICSILRTAAERGYLPPRYRDADMSKLRLPEETALIKRISEYPDMLEGAAAALEPHRLTFYLNDLAAIFHNYYNKHRVVSEDRDCTLARLFLVKCVRTVLRNALRVLGVSAPETM